MFSSAICTESVALSVGRTNARDLRGGQGLAKYSLCQCGPKESWRLDKTLFERGKIQLDKHTSFSFESKLASFVYINEDFWSFKAEWMLLSIEQIAKSLIEPLYLYTIVLKATSSWGRAYEVILKLQSVEELNSGPPSTNESPVNPGPPDYNSSALTTKENTASSRPITDHGENYLKVVLFPLYPTKRCYFDVVKTNLGFSIVFNAAEILFAYFFA